jgi:hypothetical protein
MHKNNVLDVDHILSSVMEEISYTSKGFIAWSVIGLIFGKYLITVLYTISTGSNCGSLRAALSSYFVGCPATVNSNLTALRNTGLNKLLKSSRTTPKSAIWSMMRLTFTRTGVY